jgi:hypothetical protein
MTIETLTNHPRAADWRKQGWQYAVRCYYDPNGMALAIETRHKTAASKDIEIESAKSREDIKRIDIFILVEQKAPRCVEEFHNALRNIRLDRIN